MQRLTCTVIQVSAQPYILELIQTMPVHNSLTIQPANQIKHKPHRYIYTMEHLAPVPVASVYAASSKVNALPVPMARPAVTKLHAISNHRARAPIPWWELTYELAI